MPLSREKLKFWSLRLLVLSFFLLGGFSFEGKAIASTIYSQPDSSGTISNSGVGNCDSDQLECSIVGSFSLSASTTFSPSSTGQFNLSSGNTGLNYTFYICTSSDVNTCLDTASFAFSGGSGSFPNGDLNLVGGEGTTTLSAGAYEVMLVNNQGYPYTSWSIKADASNANFYGYLTDDSGGSFDPSLNSPRFTNFVVNPGSHTVNIEGYWEASSTSPGDSQSLVFVEGSTLLPQVTSDTEVASTTGYFDFTFPFVDSSISISATSTAYTLGSDMLFNARIIQNFANFDPFNASGTAPIVLAATSTSLAASSTVTVNVGSAASLASLPAPSNCSLGNLVGCAETALTWTFYPTADTLSQFSSISLAGKFPFAYIYQLGSIREALLSASSTAPTSLSIDLWKLPGATSTTTLQLISQTQIAAVPFSGTIYLIMDALIWLGTAEYVYYRVIRVHDSVTPK